MGPSVKQAKFQNDSLAVSGGSSFSETSVLEGPVQNLSQTETVTVGLSLYQGAMPIESPEVTKLLQLIQLNTAI